MVRDVGKVAREVTDTIGKWIYDRFESHQRMIERVEAQIAAEIQSPADMWDTIQQKSQDQHDTWYR